MKINMDLEKSILNKIRKHGDEFSKSQKKLAQYILENYEKAAFMTAIKLGEEVGVSESTVVRFAYVLGYSGYPQFQKDLEDLVQNRLSSFEKIQISSDSISQEMVLDKVLESDSEKIRITLEEIDRQAFSLAKDMLLEASTIYIVGLRNCAPLADFLAYYLKLIFPHVVSIDSCNSTEIYEQLIRVNHRDVVIGISFPRYSMRTLKAMEYANNKKAKVIAITDSKHSPINMYSSCNLFAKSHMASIVDSLVAPLSIINALIVALCIERKDEVIDNLELLQNVMYDYQYSNNDEINLLEEDLMMELSKLDPHRKI